MSWTIERRGQVAVVTMTTNDPAGGQEPLGGDDRGHEGHPGQVHHA